MCYMGIHVPLRKVFLGIQFSANIIVCFENKRTASKNAVLAKEQLSTIGGQAMKLADFSWCQLQREVQVRRKLGQGCLNVLLPVPFSFTPGEILLLLVSASLCHFYCISFCHFYRKIVLIFLFPPSTLGVTRFLFPFPYLSVPQSPMPLPPIPGPFTRELSRCSQTFRAYGLKWFEEEVIVKYGPN